MALGNSIANIILLYQVGVTFDQATVMVNMISYFNHFMNFRLLGTFVLKWLFDEIP